MNQIDYKELLIKYIGHIVDHEGTDYIDEYKFDGPGCAVQFSEEEKAELKQLAVELKARFQQ